MYLASSFADMRGSDRTSMWSEGCLAMEDDLFVVDRIDQYRSICLSTLARATVQDATVGNLGSDRGYFIYEIDETPHRGGINVLAKVASLDAAFRLIDLWRMRTA